jgi:hypothetical protein
MGLMLSMLLVYAAAVTALFWRFDRIIAREPRGTYCTRCGYDLTGLTEPRCPECGTPI